MCSVPTEANQATPIKWQHVGLIHWDFYIIITTSRLNRERSQKEKNTLWTFLMSGVIGQKEKIDWGPSERQLEVEPVCSSKASNIPTTRLMLAWCISLSH